MPTLNFADIASDPEFQSQITRLRPTTAMLPGTEGKVRTTYVAATFMAIVQPTGRPKELAALAEGERISSWISVITTEPILVGGADSLSDIVLYAGEKYRVTKVDPMQAFGFYDATCEEYNGATPTQPAPAEEEEGE